MTTDHGVLPKQYLFLSAEFNRSAFLLGPRMNLEAIETLTLAVEGGSSNGHWSHNVTCPRYCLNKEEVKARNQTERFTCFDVAEKVESDHDVLFAGRVSHYFSCSMIHLDYITILVFAQTGPCSL